MSSNSHRILSVYEEELNRIVLDVHDGPVQNLFAVLSILMKMQGQIEKEKIESQTLIPQLNQVMQLIEDSLHEIKFFLGTFRSPEFQRRSLEKIIKSLVLQHEGWSQQTVNLEVKELPDEVSLPVKIALYRILQEALSNTHRHAGVDEIWVRVWMDEAHLCFSVRDEGKGFDPPPLIGPEGTERQEHIGLRGMRERVQLIGGEFELHSKVGQGTEILVKVPSYVES